MLLLRSEFRQAMIACALVVFAPLIHADPILAREAAVTAEKADATRNPGNVIFNRTGVFINAANAFPARHYAAKLKLAEVAWLALQIDNGGKVRSDNEAALKAGWADDWRAAGFKVGFWGCPRGVGEHNQQAAFDRAIPLVQADAALAAGLTARHRGEFYIADCEDSYQGYKPGDPAPGLNRVYVAAFQRAAAAAGITNIPRALSSEGRIALDMQPWIQNGWDALPQAYWNAYAVYQPSRCVDFYAKAAGWPLGRVHPTIATFKGEGENRTVTLQEYAADLKTTGTTGFSFYLPESYLRDDDAGYRQLANFR